MSGAPSTSRLLKEGTWFAFGQALNDAAFYVMVLVLAALVSPAAFGTVALGMAIVRVANLLTQAGVGGSVIADRELTREQLTASWRNTMLGALVAGVLMAVLARPVVDAFAEGSDPWVIRVLALAIVLSALSIVPMAMMRRILELKRLALISAGAAVLTAAVAIVAAVLGAGVWALVVRQLVYQAAIAVLVVRAAAPAIAALPARDAAAGAPARPADSGAFLLVASAGLLVMTVDNLLVGAANGAEQLGFYSLAFTFGFAPLTQVSWRLGQLMFPAAAATADLATVGRRTVSALRITGLALFPLVPVAIVLAPELVPAVLGEEWRPMVTPFSFLLVVGIAHAVANTIGESLSGTGNIRFRARLDVPWALLTLAAVGVLTNVDGIRGAAVGHLAAFVPLAAAYVLLATRRIGTSPLDLWRGMRGVLAMAAVQAAVTVGVRRLADGAGDPAAAAVAAVAGLAAALAVLIVLPSAPLRDVRRLWATARSRP